MTIAQDQQVQLGGLFGCHDIAARWSRWLCALRLKPDRAFGLGKALNMTLGDANSTTIRG
jgi:hypothetical protein